MVQWHKEFERRIKSSITQWLGDLADSVDTIGELGYTPVLIALSRKMPRLIELLRNDWIPNWEEITPERKQRYLSMFAKVDILTEISFPISHLYNDGFEITENHGTKGKKFIIIDDVTVSGSTLSNAIQTVKALTGEYPYVLIMFISKETYFDNEIPNLINMMFSSPWTLKELSSVSEWIAKKIEEDGLPVDMEYPVINLTIEPSEIDRYLHALIDKLKEKLQESFEPNVYWDKDFDDYIEYITVLLPNEKISFYTNDFAKIRIFADYEHGKVKMVIYSPNVLESFRLVSLEPNDLFIREMYEEIWNYLTYRMRNKLENIRDPKVVVAIERSLCIVANWLLSLSCMARNIDTVEVDEWQRKGVISVDNLKWIIGSTLTNQVAGRLQYLLFHRIDSSSSRSIHTLPETLAPMLFAEEYEVEKAFQSIICDKPEETLNAIFKFQRENIYSKRFVSPQRSARPLKGYRRFGETITGLMSTLAPFFAKRTLERDINHWIDTNIDNGHVVPRYERVATRNGIRHWKRYFHASIASETARRESTAQSID